MHHTRARKITRLSLIAGLIGLSLWAGCASKRVWTRFDPPKCVHDAECEWGFCDRGRCQMVSGPAGYGAECNQTRSGNRSLLKKGEPLMAEARGYWYPYCYGYVCQDWRCRSCESDEECVDYYGNGRCVHLTGLHTLPGAVCWPLPRSIFYENVPGSTESREICAKNPAEAPWEKRVAAGQSCLRDCDCLSAFCDRGVCADSGDIGAWNYGSGGCEPGPPHAPIDNVVTAPVWDICAGYLCVEGRCRSCQSDAECQEGSPEYKCLPLYGLPGKRCGRPSEAELGPAKNRMGPPPMPRAAPRPKGK